MKKEMRPTRFRLVPWISWNGASHYFRAGAVVSWLGKEVEFTWGSFRDGLPGTD